MTGEFMLASYRSLMGYTMLSDDRAPEIVGAGVDGPLAERLFQFSQERGIPLQVHVEVEDAFVAALERMLDKYPKAKVLWCHVGRVRYRRRARGYGAGFVRGLLERHPNLYFELSVGSPAERYAGSGERSDVIWNERTGHLEKDWARLIGDHPWRFVSSSDLAPDRMALARRKLQRERAIVEDLPLEARPIVAYKAAWKLLFGEQL